MKKSSVFLLTCIFVLGLSSFANATSISYEFSGSLYDMWEHNDATGVNTHVNQSDLFDNRLTVGDTFTGLFIYETDSLAHGLYSTYAVYLDALKNLQVNINDFSFSNLKDGAILTGNNEDSFYLYDSLYISEYHSVGNTFYSAKLFFMDRSATFTDDLLIPENLQLDSFDNKNQFNFSFLNRVSGDQLHLSGTVETLTPLATVPEPATIILFGIGILSLAGFRKKQK